MKEGDKLKGQKAFLLKGCLHLGDQITICDFFS